MYVMDSAGEPGRWERVAHGMRRTRWWVIVPLGLIYVLVTDSFGGESLEGVLLFVGGAYLWTPALIDANRNFRHGYREDEPPRRVSGGRGRR